jgi:hypothetical protein
MSEFFGNQCLENGLENSVRDEFYNRDIEQQKDKITFAEKKMTERGAETFKDELREVIREEIQNPANRNFDDFVKALWDNWNIETRVAGNTISYRHPEYKDKNNDLVSVRGSKLGDMYTVKGVKYELDKKHTERKRENIGNIYANPPATRTAELDNTATGNEPIMGSNNVFEIGRTADGRGQVSSDVNVRNNERNMQSLDGFYDRYRKPLKGDEQSSDEVVKSTKRVRNKGAR